MIVSHAKHSGTDKALISVEKNRCDNALCQKTGVNMGPSLKPL